MLGNFPCYGLIVCREVFKDPSMSDAELINFSGFRCSKVDLLLPHHGQPHGTDCESTWKKILCV